MQLIWSCSLVTGQKTEWAEVGISRYLRDLLKEEGEAKEEEEEGEKEEQNDSRMRDFSPAVSRKRRIKLAKKKDSFSRKKERKGNLAEVNSNIL